MDFPLLSEKNPLVLASASPRRKSLLEQVRLPLRVVTSQTAEGGIRGKPALRSCLLAEKKALEVFHRAGSAWTLGADTVVVIDRRILGKPANRDEAADMLSTLSGRKHKVVTGFCIVDPSGKVAHTQAVTTVVRMKPLSREEIDGYIGTGEPYGKAGSYAIQGIGSFMVEGLSGSYTNVVGLPLCALISALVSLGALHRFPLPS